MIDLRLGDCLEVLKEIPDNSVDSIVTDPPYGLSFMGKKWDYDVPSEDVWRECLRVLKPGGHLLSFAGSRTYHRMAVRIEDAGFGIRDQIMWIYGSGFPKSLDVSKAIDKQRDDAEPSARVAEFLMLHRGGRGLSEFREYLNLAVIGERHSGGSAQGWTTTRTTGTVKPRVPTWGQWLQLKELLGFDSRMDDEVWRLNGRKGTPGEAWEQREVVSQRRVMRNSNSWETSSGMLAVGEQNFDVTAPATEQAKQWEGWGSALKPAHEPIVLARKPLCGTIAQNVLEHGTGGLNIDGCRIATDWAKDRGDTWLRSGNDAKPLDRLAQVPNHKNGSSCADRVSNLGRFPANIIHDGSDEVVELFPRNAEGKDNFKHSATSIFGSDTTASEYNGDSKSSWGSAARFFYCAKSSKSDRGDGNNHPTVKPTDLMKYLCRLITPPNGIVLDPFMGSGSTGKGAVLEGFRFIGIEREPEYFEIAKARIESAAQDLKQLEIAI